MLDLNILSTTSCRGRQHLEDKDRGNSRHSRNLNSSGRYSSASPICTLPTRNLRFFILLKTLAFNDSFVHSGESNIMLRILFDPCLRQKISHTYNRIRQKYKDFETLNKTYIEKIIFCTIL